MTPCMRLYALLGRLARGRTSVAPLYAEWVKTYADPGFEALAVRLEALLDLHAKDTERRPRQLSPPAMELELRLLRRQHLKALGLAPRF